MRVYPIEAVMRDVRVAMDRNTVSAPLLGVGDVDTLSYEEVIRSKIPEAVRRVHCEAPVHLVDGLDFSDRDIVWMEKESGYVILPDDFMRFVAFAMSDWETPVWSAVTTDDQEYELQRSPFKGIRGTYRRPVAAIAVRACGKVLEFYSCRSRDAEVSLARYLPFPRIEDPDGIAVCERCYEAVVYTAASLALTTFGDAQGAQGLVELAKSTLT